MEIQTILNVQDVQLRWIFMVMMRMEIFHLEKDTGSAQIVTFLSLKKNCNILRRTFNSEITLLIVGDAK